MIKITLNTDKNDINTTICKLNKLFGNSPANTWEDGWNLKIKSQISNIWDEILELEEAINNNDRVEIMDAYGDIITFLYGVSFYTGGTLLHGTSLHLAPIEPHGDDMSTSEHVMLLKDYYHSIMTSFESYAEGEDVDDVDRIELFIKFNTNVYDFLYHVNGIAVRYGFDPVEVLDRVTVSNLTKFCESDEEAEETMLYYSDLGIETYYKEVLVDESTAVYVVYSSKNQEDINGKMYRANKFLKNQGTFTTPDFSDL